MAKIRIYELAKELGLENKVILDLCSQLGIQGKKSHSNSLSDEEAENIRRSVIRRAVSGKASVRELVKEGQVLTERRVGKGSVIRRRKKDSEQTAEEEQSAAAVVEESPVEEVQEESEEVVPEVEAASKEAVSEKVEEVAQEESPLVEVAAVETTEVVTQEPSKPSEAEYDSLRKKHDVRAPKVLGKIELPVEKVEKSKEASDDADKKKKGKKFAKQAPKQEDNRRDANKRRKKQVLKKDQLLDYDNERNSWRSKKDKKSRRKDGDSHEDTGAVRQEPAKVTKPVVKIDGEISVGEFAKQLGEKVGSVLQHLMNLGIMANINQLIDFETASLIAAEYEAECVNVGTDVEELVNSLVDDDDESKQTLRPPIVTVMGHVDHGKTSLLDAIRKTTVTKGEFGGITQHIGAYNVKVKSGGSVTFLDTPGHEAFTAMRSRGASITDIVVLVVAADDGIMPQTIEAINHAKAAGVPIIVAVNKIDKEDANIEKIKTQLAEHELIPEDWGGDTILAPVSAITGEGIDGLLENLHLQAEILELKANPEMVAVGTVIESKVDRGRGPVITVLVQKGTLKQGNIFFSGSVAGKVRALVSDDGSTIKEAGPSIPVEILGASSAPLAGDDFVVAKSDSQARKIAEMRQQKARQKELVSQTLSTSDSGGLTLESLSEMIGEGELKELPIIVKADVRGSSEAVVSSLERLSNAEVKVNVIHKGVGAITENDVQLASASKGIIVGFNVRADSRAAPAANAESVQILYSRIIYELIETVESILTGMLKPIEQEKTLGRVEVRTTFKVPKQGLVAGSYVLDGRIERGALVRLLRDNAVVYEGKMSSLRRFKEDVKEVAAGYECGIGIEGYTDIKDGDVIEVYKVEHINPALAQAAKN